MAFIYGSSSIPSFGKTGPTGPTGPAGPTGATGPGGVSGDIITEILRSFPGGSFGNKYQLDIRGIRDGESVSFSELLNKYPFIEGATGFVSGAGLENFGGGTKIAHGISGATFNFRTLTTSGSLTSKVTDDTIIIGSSLVNDETNTDNIRNNSLVYAQKRNEISSTAIDISTDTANSRDFLDFKADQTGTAGLNHTVALKSPEIVEDDNAGITGAIIVDLSESDVYRFDSPVAISGITGSYPTGYSITKLLYISGGDVRAFPPNVFFENGEDYFTCGTDALAITTTDGGENWYGIFSARGYDTLGCDGAGNVPGSCCFFQAPSGQTIPPGQVTQELIEQGGTFICSEYQTKNQCDAVNGDFNLLQACYNTCGIGGGVCCSEGRCTSNVNPTECASIGGAYFDNVMCENNSITLSDGTIQTFNPEGPNYAEPIQDGRFCFDECDVTLPCCVRGICIGDKLTRIQCELIYGGISQPPTASDEGDSVPLTCSGDDIDQPGRTCCEEVLRYGACCIPFSQNEDGSYSPPPGLEEYEYEDKNNLNFKNNIYGRLLNWFNDCNQRGF